MLIGMTTDKTRICGKDWENRGDITSGAIEDAKVFLNLYSRHTLWLNSGGKQGSPMILKNVRFIGPMLPERPSAPYNLSHAIFVNCSLGDLDFSRALFRGATFINCDISGKFVQADFSHAIIQESQFAFSKLVGAKFDNVKFLSREQGKLACLFHHNNMYLASFRGADMSAGTVKLVRATFGRPYINTDHHNLNVDGADLTGLIFKSENDSKFWTKTALGAAAKLPAYMLQF